MLSLNASTIAFFRVFFAALILAPIMLVFKRSELRASAGQLKLLALNGLFLSMGWVFLFLSMKLIPIADAVLLNYLAPVFAAALAPFFLGEKLEKSALLALPLAFSGTVLISYEGISGSPNPSPLGVFSGILAGVSYAGFILTSKKLRTSLSGLGTAFSSYCFASIFLSLALFTPMSLDLPSLIILVFLGGFNTGLAVTLYFHGLGLIEAQRAVVFTYLEPLSAACFGFAFLGQVMGLSAVLGGILIVAAGFLVARS